jgi:hypothetical protein
MLIDEQTKIKISSPIEISSFTYSIGRRDTSILTANLSFINSNASFSFHSTNNINSEAFNNMYDSFNKPGDSDDIHKIITMLYSDFFTNPPKRNNAKALNINNGNHSFSGQGFIFTDESKQLDYFNIVGNIKGQKVYIMYRNNKETIDNEIDYSLIECFLNNLEMG